AKRLEVTAVSVPPELRGPNVVRVGNPHDEILAAADKLDVDMIVLTTKGRAGINRFFVGGTAEQIMRHAKCPVLSTRRL
ncbi:MAG: universal stress protein, partial [Opitutaceae bacterium]